MEIRPAGAMFFHTEFRQVGRQTDRHDEANSHFSKICERA